MIKRISYDKCQILSVTSDGIRYLDDAGQGAFIDFHECRRNWVHFVNESDTWPTVTVLPEEECICVGWRDWFENPAYFEFFTEPRTRFEIRKPRSAIIRWFVNLIGKSASQKFVNFQFVIDQAGWSIFDLG